MALKQIPFSLEMVKKIQAGEIKGTIRTRDGRKARFLEKIKDPVYPLVFSRETKNSEKELLDVYTLTGEYSVVHDEHAIDIILEIETNDKEKQDTQFKPFDKVLVRDLENEEWKADFFSRYYTDNLCKYECITGAYAACIPYAGNEHLLGTNNKPKENKL